MLMIILLNGMFLGWSVEMPAVEDVPEWVLICGAKGTSSRRIMASTAGVVSMKVPLFKQPEGPMGSFFHHRHAGVKGETWSDSRRFLMHRMPDR